MNSYNKQNNFWYQLCSFPLYILLDYYLAEEKKKEMIAKIEENK
jgi:hypothetical protein